MINRVVYVLVVLVIAYNIWFDSYEEKKTSIDQVRCYLSLRVSDDAELVEYIADMKGRFIIWSVLDSPNKDVAYKLKKLETYGWKLYSIKENNKRIFYTLKKII